MRSFLILRVALLGFVVVLLGFAATQCQADEQVIEVVGIGECADCTEKKIQANHAFPGLHVTVDCKNELGSIERWGVGKLNEEGKFKVSLPKEMLNDGKLKHECYAQLHSASSALCPAQNGLKSIKLVAKNDADGKHITFEPAQKLTFSTEVCTSATFLPSHKPLPKIDLKHHFGHHYKFPPLLKKPLPPMFPTPVPKTPEPPVTKPEPPVTVPKKPEPPSKPKKPCPPEPKKKSKPENPKKDEPKKKKPEKPKKNIPEKPKKNIPEKPKKEEPKKPMPPMVIPLLDNNVF